MQESRIFGLMQRLRMLLTPSRRVLRTRKLILEDSAGQPRADFGIDDAGNTVLNFRDKEGGVRLLIGLQNDGTPRITLTYAKGAGRVELEANDRVNTAGLAIQGPSGRVQAIIGVARNGLPAMVLFDQEGKVLYPAEDAANAEEPPDFDWDDLLRGGP